MAASPVARAGCAGSRCDRPWPSRSRHCACTPLLVQLFRLSSALILIWTCAASHPLARLCYILPGLRLEHAPLLLHLAHRVACVPPRPSTLVSRQPKARRPKLAGLSPAPFRRSGCQRYRRCRLRRRRPRSRPSLHRRRHHRHHPRPRRRRPCRRPPRRRRPCPRSAGIMTSACKTGHPGALRTRADRAHSGALARGRVR